MRKETHVLLPIYPKPYIAVLVECYKACCTNNVAPQVHLHHFKLCLVISCYREDSTTILYYGASCDGRATEYSLFCDRQDVSKPAGFDLILKWPEATGLKTEGRHFTALPVEQCQ